MFVNDSIFVQAVSTDQEYCGQIFSWPICFVMASFWTTFHIVLEGTTLRMYSQATRGPELFLLQEIFFYMHYFSKMMEKKKTA